MSQIMLSFLDFLLTKNIFTLLKEKYSNTYFSSRLCEAEKIMKP
jgi:hypothetical protein